MYFFAGFHRDVLDAFQMLGGTPSVWLRIDPSSSPPQNVETHQWQAVVRSDVPHSFQPDLDPRIARRVRTRSGPYFARMHERLVQQHKSSSPSWLDVANKLEKMIQFFYGSIKRNRIQYVVSQNIPHEGAHIILYYLAEELGLRNIVLSQSIFPNAFWMLQRFEDFGVFETGTAEPGLVFELAERPEAPFYMQNVKSNDAPSQRLIHAKDVIGARAKALGVGFGLRKSLLLKHFHKSEHRAALASLHTFSSTQQPVPGERYVYFPLHLQPEMTTDTLGHSYADQLTALEELRRALPDEISIYIKENPKQGGRLRGASFLERLRALPNTRYLPIDCPSLELIDGCEAVATITGTAGWEALQLGKPVICFGSAWYRELHGAFPWHDGFDYETIENFQHNRTQLQADFNEVCGYLRRGVVDPVYTKIAPNFNAEQNARDVAAHIYRFAQQAD